MASSQSEWTEKRESFSWRITPVRSKNDAVTLRRRMEILFSFCCEFAWSVIGIVGLALDLAFQHVKKSIKRPGKRFTVFDQIARRRF